MMLTLCSGPICSGSNFSRGEFRN